MRRVKAILVHGTFARDTDWDDPDAPFATALKTRLAEHGDTLDVEEYGWSGENAHDARRVAAEGLAEKLRAEGRGDYDDLFLIGHSHGGTVVRLALNKLGEEERPTGVFTLGAPFVRFKPKAVASVATVITILLRVLALLAVAFAAALFYDYDPLKAWMGDPMMHGGATALLALFLAWFLAVFCPSRLRRWAVSRLSATQKELIENYDPPERRRTPYVCFHAIGDEAGLLLRFWSLVTWLLQTGVFITVYGAIAMLLIAIPMLAYKAGVDFGVIQPETTEAVFGGFIEAMRALGGLIDVQVNDPAEVSAEKAALMVPEAAASVAPALFSVTLAFALFSSPITLFVPWLLRSRWFAFGGEKLTWNLAADIQVDRRANPVSAMRYVFMPRAYLKGEIQHNFYYFSKTVINDIANRMCAWRPPRERRSFYLGRAIGRVVAIAILVVFVVSAAPLTWLVAELWSTPAFEQSGGPAQPSGEAAPEPVPTE